MKLDNELIAEFMWMKVYDYGADTCYVEGPGFPNSPPTLAEFDTSWDWLMPVVEAIEEIEEPVSADPQKGGCWPYQIEILSRQTVQIIDNRTNESIVSINQDGLTKIQSVYKAVVEFIKWHNSQNE